MQHKHPDSNQPGRITEPNPQPPQAPLSPNTINLIARYLSWETTPEEDSIVLDLIKKDQRIQQLVSDGINLEAALIKPATTEQQYQLDKLQTTSAEVLTERAIKQSFLGNAPKWALSEEKNVSEGLFKRLLTKLVQKLKQFSNR